MDGSVPQLRRQHSRLRADMAGHVLIVRVAGFALLFRPLGHVEALVRLQRRIRQHQEEPGKLSRSLLRQNKSRAGTIAVVGEMTRVRGPSAQRLSSQSCSQTKLVYSIAWSAVFSWRAQKTATVVSVETFLTAPKRWRMQSAQRRALAIPPKNAGVCMHSAATVLMVSRTVGPVLGLNHAHPLFNRPKSHRWISGVWPILV